MQKKVERDCSAETLFCMLTNLESWGRPCTFLTCEHYHFWGYAVPTSQNKNICSLAQVTALSPCFPSIPTVRPLLKLSNSR